MEEGCKQDDPNIPIWSFKNQESRRSLRKTLKSIVKTFNKSEIFKQLQVAKHEICEDGIELTEIFDYCRISSANIDFLHARITACLLEELRNVGSFEIIPFGSFVTNLALLNSDMDIFIKNLNDNDDKYKTYNKIVRVLNKSKCFISIAPIRNARVPIIRCIHEPTKFSLDINVHCPSSIIKTKFLQDLIQWDERIYELILFLKVWANNLQISGRGNLTSYGLLSLIYFYLQNTKPNPILPSFQELQMNLPPFIEKGVNYAASIENKLSPINNNCTTLDLIKEFFLFYHNYDFEKNIIATYLGISISRSDFVSGIFKFKEYDLQTDSIVEATGEPPHPLNVDKPMCVQDTFCLHVNITHAICEVNFNYFQTCLRLANNIISDSRIQSGKQFYKSLLFKVTDELFEEISQTKTTPSSSFNCVIKPCRSELKFVSQHFKEDNINILFKLWAEQFISLIFEFITDIYKIDIMPNTSPHHNAKNKKLDDSHSIITWTLTGSVDLWSERDHQKPNSQTYFEFNRAQTCQLFEKRRQNSTFSVRLNGYLTISCDDKNREIEWSIHPYTERVLCKKDPICKFFRILKQDLQNLKLKDKLLLSALE